jgi:hypothetical protein
MTKARIRYIRAIADRGIEYADVLTECLDEIERLQTFTRAGREPTPDPEETQDLPPAAKNGKQPPDPRVKQLIDGWAIYFEKFHRLKYRVQGAKDGAAAKRLVKLMTVDEILDIAWNSWLANTERPNVFCLRQALTIAGFDSQLTAIQVEIKNIHQPKTPEPQCKL